VNRPQVSVLMSAYNQARYLPEALASLREQTLSAAEVEVIVINDGSTDDTGRILREHRSWLRLVERENRGLVVSCNEALSLAQGQTVARLDCDDLVAPDWLESLLEALKKHPQACCVYPDRYEIFGMERRLVRVAADNLYDLIACGTLFRTETLKQVGGFRPFFWEEYDLYLRLKHQSPLLHHPQPLYLYRKHPEGMTQNASRRQEGWRELARAWGRDLLLSAGSDPDLEHALQTSEVRSKP